MYESLLFLVLDSCSCVDYVLFKPDFPGSNEGSSAATEVSMAIEAINLERKLGIVPCERQN